MTPTEVKTAARLLEAQENLGLIKTRVKSNGEALTLRTPSIAQASAIECVVSGAVALDMLDAGIGAIGLELSGLGVKN